MGTVWPATTFVDREQELAELRALADRGRPGMALLYGRRRVGKTYLLDYAWSGRRMFYFLAADSTAEMNRSELVRDLSAWSGRTYIASDYPTWRTIFRLLVGLADEEPLIVVLDEFQYLMGQEDDIVSQLAAVWDRELADRPLTLALCGSEVSTMDSLKSGGQPLFGRLNWSARLRPFDYYDAARMLAGRSLRDAVVFYGVYGGIPRYLAAVDGKQSLAESACRLMMSPRGEVHLQLQNAIEQEKGIREASDYRAVLAAIAGGQTEVNQIALATGLERRPHTIRRALAVLEDLDFVWKERNFAAPEKAAYRYLIADNAVRFWYRFVHPNRGQLETADTREVWRRRVEPYLNDFMGKVFESVCREAFVRHHARWGWAGHTDWARWEGQDRNRRSIEIDIVARLEDGRLLAGEIKWSSRPLGPEVHAALIRNLEDLAHSGQSWASDTLSAGRSAGCLYFSASGFTDEFRQMAGESEQIRLVDLEGLFQA